VSVGFLDRPAESDARFRSLFDASPIGMAVFEPGGAWLRANAAAVELLGYSAAELAGSDVGSVTHPDDRAADRTHLDDLLAGRVDGYRTHKRFVHRDGQPVPCLVGVTALRDETGEVRQLLAQIVDRTGVVATEEALHRSEEQFRTAFDASPLGSALTGPDGRFRRVNPAFEAMLDRPAADLIDHHFTEFTHPDDRTASEV